MTPTSTEVDEFIKQVQRNLLAREDYYGRLSRKGADLNCRLLRTQHRPGETMYVMAVEGKCNNLYITARTLSQWGA